MIRIAHISDLHFGRENDDVLEALRLALRKGGYRLVVVTGDFTMRARQQEFEVARAFLDDLPCPWLGVPGNHDLAARASVKQLLFPLNGYKRYLAKTAEPRFRDGDLAVAGVNSARRAPRGSAEWSRGRVGFARLKLLEQWFRFGTEDSARIVALHHPLSVEEGGLDGVSRRILRSLELAGVEVAMTGHLHRADFTRYVSDSSQIVISQCSTSCSTRLKGETNSFNEVVLDDASISCVTRYWRHGRFQPDEPIVFPRSRPAAEPAIPALAQGALP